MDKSYKAQFHFFVMKIKQWGMVWEDKIKSQKNEVSIIHGNNSSIKKVNEELKKDFNNFEKWLFPLLPKKASVLDCGVGPMARHSIEFSKRGYDVTGVDISKTTLEYAKKWATKENQKIDFVEANLVDLSKISKTFDLVFCTQTFGHIPAYLALDTLKQFYNKTKKSKYCLIEFWIDKERSSKQILYSLVYQLFHKIRRRFVKSYHVNCSSYTHEEIRDMIKRARFRIVKNTDGYYLLQKI